MPRTSKFGNARSVRFLDERLKIVQARYPGLDDIGSLIRHLVEREIDRGDASQTPAGATPNKAAQRLQELGVDDAVTDFYAYDFTSILQSDALVCICLDNLQQFLSKPANLAGIIARFAKKLPTRLAIAMLEKDGHLHIDDHSKFGLRSLVNNLKKDGFATIVAEDARLRKLDGYPRSSLFHLSGYAFQNVSLVASATVTVACHHLPLTNFPLATIYRPSEEPTPYDGSAMVRVGVGHDRVASLKRSSIDFHAQYQLLADLFTLSEHRYDFLPNWWEKYQHEFS